MRKRTQAREFALIILYQKEVTRFEIQTVVDNFLQQEEKVDPEVRTFMERLVFGIHLNLEKIDEKISLYATNWQLKRMAVIDRNILRLGLYELLFADDIPPKVTINEAVELAKKYGDVESSKFVNGILDKIHKTEILMKKSGNDA
ncbi:MAG: transcription antitermination factor NusB [Candidatus Omnitrophota bacterium]